MTTTVRTEKELGAALKAEEDEIVVEIELAGKVIRIKATGNIAWTLAIGAIAVAVTATIASGGVGAPAGLVALGPAALAIGGPAVVASAVSIAVAAGGVGALNSLRKYKMTKLSDGRVLLKR